MALAACGGGGGGGGSSGGGGSTGNGSTTPAPAALTVDRTTLSWEMEEGETASAQLINGAINGATEPVFLFVEYTNTALGQPQFEMTGTTTGRLLVAPPQWNTLQPGSYTDRVTIKACYDSACTRPVAGSPKTVDVSYVLKAAVPAPALELSQYGAAFTAAPHGHRLSQSVTVRDTGSSTSQWTASSDAAWLHVTPAGTAGGSLAMTADDAGLAEGQYTATVTVRSDNTRITQPQTLSVGLYVTRSARATTTSGRPATGPYEGVILAVDPVRPVFYAAQRGVITARHFYTGDVKATWTVAPSGSGEEGSVQSMAVSDDGRELYALERSTKKVYVIDLVRNQLDRSFSTADLTDNGGGLTFFRLNGRGMLLTNRGSASTISVGISTLLNPQTGTKEGNLALDGAGFNLLDVTPSQDGRYLFASREIGATRDVMQVRPAVNSKGTLFSRVAIREGGGLIQQMPSGGIMNGLDILQSVGDTMVTAPSPIRDAINALNSYSRTHLLLGSDGRMLISTNPSFGNAGDDLWLFGADGTLKLHWKDSTFDSEAFFPYSGGAMPARISSDGLRAVSDYKLVDLPN
jgi:hypothetical protein